MKNIKKLSLIIISMIMTITILNAQTIKLGSLAPKGSPWDKSLRQLAREWSRISGGKVKMKIYPGGIAGDEGDMLRKMRFGQLDASGITGVGLARIFPGVITIQLPYLIRTDKEMVYVLKNIRRYLEKNLEKKGFKVIIWNIAGWTYFFSKKPIISPDDLKKQKIFVWEGDSDLTQTWKELGFHPVPIAATEIMTSLQSGMIDTLATSPLLAASYQWFGIAKHMCTMKWSPFVGAVVVTKKTWKKIKPEWQEKFIKSAEKIGKKMQRHTLKTDKEAIKTMKKYGLKQHSVPKKIQKKWEKVVEQGLRKLFGKTVHKETYEKVKKLLAEYHKKK